MFFIFFIITSCLSEKKKEVRGDISFEENSELNNYWVKYKFTQSEVDNYPDMIEQSLVDYVTHFSLFPMEAVQSSLKQLIQKSESDTVFYRFLKDKFANYLYHPNSPFRNDLYYEQILLAYKDSPFLSAEELKINSMVLDLVRKNQIGTKASNFSFLDKEGKECRLHDIEADYKLLVFYDPLCSHCKEVLEQMKQSSVLKDEIAANRLKVVAVDIMGDFKNWELYQSQIPSTWINGFDKAGIVQSEMLYNILAYPTLYLLRKNNTVVLKDVYFQDVESYFIK